MTGNCHADESFFGGRHPANVLFYTTQKIFYARYSKKSARTDTALFMEGFYHLTKIITLNKFKTQIAKY